MVEVRASRVFLDIRLRKPLREEGNTAEGSVIRKAGSGMMQNMYRTVTDVESYRHIDKQRLFMPRICLAYSWSLFFVVLFHYLLYRSLCYLIVLLYYSILLFPLVLLHLM